MAMQNADTVTSRRMYEPYLEAAWGLKNHWYPAAFSKEIAEDEVKAVQIIGVPIVLRRADGKTHALRDQCIHRGVKLSARPTCLTKNTLTCWYHGFTYDLETGNLRTILAAPNDELIGNAAIQVFPVQEHNGMIFVFVGDPGYEPVPLLEDDLPMRMPRDYEHRVAHPLDENTVLLGIHRTGNANWRLAVENGFDPGHQMVHANSQMVRMNDMSLPIGLTPLSDKAVKVLDEGGPKGIMNMVEHYDWVWSNEEMGVAVQGNNAPPAGLRTSMYLPGTLMVENWPAHGLVQYEWYVPIDDTHHEYWEVLAKECNSPAEKKAFEQDVENLWEPVALRNFNDDDLFAREAMEPFYANGGGRGWEDEMLCSMDAVIVGWRKVASRYNRGIQSPPN